jgi:DNA replicative helicase MCM subunit Mcm2 (Cdc46/Mcm family)
MVTIVCKNCDKVIEYYEDEKVSVLYSQCENCLKVIPDE